MNAILSVDPGDVHVGTAWWGTHQLDTPGHWRCYATQEYTPDQFEAVLGEALNAGLKTVVVEDFILDRSLAPQQAGSKMGTSQLIGSIKTLVRVHNRDADHPAELVLQNRSIKTPTRGILRARRMRSKAKISRAGGHCLDAELHGYYYIEHTLGQHVEQPIKDEGRIIV